MFLSFHLPFCADDLEYLVLLHIDRPEEMAATGYIDYSPSPFLRLIMLANMMFNKVLTPVSVTWELRPCLSASGRDHMNAFCESGCIVPVQ